MATRGAIDLSFRADLSNLTKQLAQMPNATEKEAKAMVKALEKQFKNAEKAAERAAKSAGNAWQKSGKRVRGAAADTKRVSEEMDQLSHRAGDADSALKGVGGALGLISPEAEAVFQTVGELGGGLEGMIRTLKAGIGPLGLVAAAVAAGAFAWNHYSEELEEAEKQVDDMAAASLEMANAVNAMKASLEIRELEALVKLGQEDVKVLERAKVERSVAADLSKTRGLLLERESKALDALSSAQSAYNDDQARADYWGVRALANDREHNAEIKRKEQLLKASRRALKNLDAEQAFQVQLTLDGIEADKKNNKSKSKSTSSIRKNKDAIEELIEATNRLIPDDRSKVQILAEQYQVLQEESQKSATASERLAPAMDKIRDAIDKINLDEYNEKLTKTQEATQKYRQGLIDQASSMSDSATASEKAMDLLRELQIENEKTGGTNEDLSNSITDVQAKLDQFQADEAKKELQDLAQKIQAIGGAWTQSLVNIGQLNLNAAVKDGKKALEVFDKRASHLDETLADINDQISATTDEATKEQLQAEKDLIEGRIEANEEAREKEKEIQNEAIRKAFAAQQAFQVAQIIMNTATAVMSAYAQPWGPVAGAVAAAGISALGATQIALVQQQEPPTMHMGGMIRPDEQMVKARIGEGMLTAQGVDAIGGESGLNAANQGRATGQRLVIQQVFKHKVLDQVLTESIERGGPIRSAINRRNRRGRKNPNRRAS